MLANLQSKILKSFFCFRKNYRGLSYVADQSYWLTSYKFVLSYVPMHVFAILTPVSKRKWSNSLQTVSWDIPVYSSLDVVDHQKRITYGALDSLHIKLAPCSFTIQWGLLGFSQ